MIRLCLYLLLVALSVALNSRPALGQSPSPAANPYQFPIPSTVSLSPGGFVTFVPPACSNVPAAGSAPCPAQPAEVTVAFTASSSANATAAVSYDGSKLRIVTAPGLALVAWPPAGAVCRQDNDYWAIVCTNVLPSSPPASVTFRATSALSQTAGIPGTIFLPLGGMVTFTSGGQSLTVDYQWAAGVPQPMGTAQQSQVWDAAVSYDGELLVLSVPAVLTASVTAAPPDDQRCVLLNGVPSGLRCSIRPAPGRGPVHFLISNPPPSTGDCEGLLLQPGWNLESGGIARLVNSNVGPIYSLDADTNQYVPVGDARSLPDTGAYWVLFDTPTRVSDRFLSGVGLCGPARREQPAPVSVELPAGQWVMAGNPFAVATVQGADAVFTYVPVNGYQQTSRLDAGQGALAYSANGATLTFTPAGG